MEVRGHERRRRCAQAGEEHSAVLREVADVFAGEAEEFSALVGAEQEQAELNDWADGV